jgi:hypothetical protein
LFSIAMIAILAGLVDFAVLNAGRLPCREGFLGRRTPGEQSYRGTAAAAKVIALFTENSLSIVCRPLGEGGLLRSGATGLAAASTRPLRYDHSPNPPQPRSATSDDTTDFAATPRVSAGRMT